ncbi:MAG: DNA polymerase III subunit chi [Gammaproteobacteria bacterium]|nr:MAG: DNA polymerase III subunit chi [Gammaproteobacteria bacterium]
MTRVDFYILDNSQSRAKTLFACRLTEKIYKSGYTLLLYTSSEKQSSDLDNLLWTFRQGSFVPHAIYTASSSSSAPVLITNTMKDSNTPAQVLVNLCDDVPNFFSRFERVAEIVDGNNRIQSRKRYRFYQERGYPLHTHNLANT